VETFVNLAIDAFKQLGAMLVAFWNFIKPLVGKELSAILDVFKGTFQVVAGLLQWLSGLFTGDFEAMSAGGSKILEGFGNAAKGVFLGIVQPIMFVAETLQTAFGAAIDWVLNKFTALGEKWDAFKAAIGFGGGDSGGTPQASAAQSSSPAAIAGATNNKSVQSTTKIDNITVNTQATDAKGIAGDMGQAVQSQQMAMAFDGGTW
jgi:hypothetical protein